MTDSLDGVENISGIPSIRIMVYKHLKAIPSKVIIFDGAFRSACESQLSVVNTSKSRVAYIMETSCPELFMITPMIALLEPGKVATVKILMNPIETNEDVSVISFTMYSVVVIGQVQLSAINKSWLDKQPHNVTKEVWTCKFAQPVEENPENVIDESEPYAMAPAMPRRQNVFLERSKQMRKLRKRNEKLHEELRWLRMNRPTGRRDANREVRLGDLYRANIRGLFILFGIDINDLQIWDIRNLVLFMGAVIFFMGVLVGYTLF